MKPLCFQWFPALRLCGAVGAARHLRGGIGSECGRCATVPRCALCGASPCPVRCVPGCGWAVTPSDRLRGCAGFCGGCGCVFHINRYLRPPCAPVVPCGGSVCPLRGSDGVPCPAPPLRTICRPAWPVVRPVGSVCGVGWVSASMPPIAPPVPSCALSQHPTIPPWLCPASATICAPAPRLAPPAVCGEGVRRSAPVGVCSAPAHPVGITTAPPASPPPAASAPALSDFIHAPGCVLTLATCP